MNELLSKILERSPREKLVILGVSLGLLAGLYFTFIHQPRSNVIAKLTEELEFARKQKAVKEQKASNIPKLQKELQEWNIKLKQAIAQLPDSKEIPELLSNVSTKAREAGLEILSFRPRAENFRDFYAEIPVDIVVRGGFYNAVTFFEEVGKLNRLVNMDNIDLKNPKVSGDQVSLDISALATTYRFLDEAERQKVAAEKAKATKK